MPGYEGIGNNRVLAARASKVHRMPIVIEPDFANWQQEKCRLWRGVPLGRYGAAQHKPLRMIAAARKTPNAGKKIASVCSNDLTKPSGGYEPKAIASGSEKYSS